jgi:hypothetical protein
MVCMASGISAVPWAEIYRTPYKGSTCATPATHIVAWGAFGEAMEDRNVSGNSRGCRGSIRFWHLDDRSTIGGAGSITAEEKERIAARTDRTENCETIKTFPRNFICRQDQENVERGAQILSYPSLPKYIAINLTAALSAFAVIFGLTSLIQRYWT